MMMRRRTSVGGVTTGLMAGALALVSIGYADAQAPGPGEAASAQIQARFQILAMEGVLEKAVLLGAQRVRAEVQAAMPDAPDMLVISGGARARGFWLDGYGIFFDVDVPAMRKSIIWTVQMLEQNDRGLGSEIAALKRLVAGVDDPAARRNLQQTVQRIEAQVGPARVAAAEGRGVRPEGAPSATVVSDREADRAAILDDPGAVYTTQVKNALVDAMIEYGTPLPLGPTDWLTVAARDQGVSRLQPGDPYDATTILVRIKGADLAAFRAGQIDREATRRRVELKEY
jgi:hypothetical protein